MVSHGEKPGIALYASVKLGHVCEVHPSLSIMTFILPMSRLSTFRTGNKGDIGRMKNRPR